MGKGREQDAEALKTRFWRCAQVMDARRSKGTMEITKDSINRLIVIYFATNVGWPRKQFNIRLS
jgi:hypothetical protein